MEYVGTLHKNTYLPDGYLIHDVWTVVDLKNLLELQPDKKIYFGKFFSKQLGVPTRIIFGRCYIKGKLEENVINNLYQQLLV